MEAPASNTDGDANALPPTAAEARRRGAPFWIDRAGMLALDVAGELVAVALGLALVWSLALAALVARGGADVTALLPSVEAGIARALGGRDAEVGSLRLVVVPEDDRVSLVGRNIAVREGGRTVDGVERLRADLRLSALSRGAVRLLALRADGGTLSVVRREGGEVVAGLGPPEALGTLGPVIEIGGGGGERGLPAVDLRGATVHLRDERDGVSWVLRDAAARVSRRGAPGAPALRARVVGRLEAGGGGGAASAPVVAAPVAVGYAEDGGARTLTVALETADLSAFAAERGPLARLALLRLPVRRLRAERTGGETGPATTSFEVEAGAGTVGGVGAAGVEVEGASLAGTLQGDALSLSRVELDAAGVSLAGRAEVTVGREVTEEGEAALKRVAASLRLERFSARVEALPTDTLELDAPELDVVWEPGRVEVPRFRVGLAGTRFRGRVAADLGPGSGRGLSLRSLSLRVDADGAVRPETLLGLWPETFVGGARRWIARSVLDGRLEDLSLRADLPPEFFQGEDAGGERAAVADEALDLTFRVEDGRVRYISTMTPLEGASGRGHLRGNSFRFDLEAGRVGALGVREASVEMPRLVPKGGDFTVEVRGEGSAETLLRLIDEEPFRFASRYDLDPAEFRGRGEVELSVTRPLREFITPDQVAYAVRGDFAGVAVPFRLFGQPLTDGTLRVEADRTRLSVAGPVNFGPWRPTLTYFDTLGDGDVTPTRARLEGVLGREALDGFGVGLRQYLGGEVGVRVDAVSNGMTLLHADVEADLGAAELNLPPWWSKRAGVPATARAQLGRAGGDGAVTLDGVGVDAPGFELRGRAAFEADARLREAVVERLRIDDVMDLGMTVVPNTERTQLVARAQGSFIDLSPAVRERLASPGARERSGLPVRLEARFDRVALVEGYLLSGVAAEYSSDGTTIRSARLSGTTDAGPASLTLEPSGGGGGGEGSDGGDGGGGDGTRELALALPDASGAARALFGFGGTRGGALRLSATVPPPGSGRSVLGEVAVDDLVLSNAPILAQLLSLASLEGLGNALSGQGLRFAEVESEWAFRDGRLSLRRTRASGPALGLTVEGEVALGERVLDLNGVIVPAYTANSFLGDIPLLGDILVGEEGEGIVGLNYFVQGPFNAAQVGVNPLSALTPGVFREIFKPQREGLPGVNE